MSSLNGGYAMIKYNSTQEELQIAYRSKRPVLFYDENQRSHWAVIEETATESVDEETQEPITLYEYSYRLIDKESSVVANPTLSGNEATLDGVEIDGTKYKVGGGSGGKLYRHDIYMLNSHFSCVLVTSLYYSNSTPMTKYDFHTFITKNTGKGYLCSGKIKINNVNCPIICCDTTGMRYISADGSDFGTQSHLSETSYDVFTDTVTEV